MKRRPDRRGPGTGCGAGAYLSARYAEGGHGVRALPGGETMVKFLLFCILLVLCWPLALVALVAYPLVWLLLLPFRVVGIAVGGVLALISALLLLPGRVLRAI